MMPASERIPTATLAATAEHFALGKIHDATRMPGTNQNYLVTTDSGTYLFKIIVNTTLDDILQSLPFLQRIEKHGFPAVSYCQAPDGQVFYHSPADDVVVLPSLPGSMPSPSLTINRAVGSALATLHQIPCEQLPPKPHWLDTHYLPEAIEAATQLYGAERLQETLNVFHALEHFQPAAFPQNIVHGDLDPSNCLFEEDRLVAFVDWQEVGIGAALLDFASTVLGFCFVEQPDGSQSLDTTFDPRSYAALYEGYISVRPFSLEEKAHLGDALKYVGLTQPVWSMLHWEQYHPGQEMQETQTMYWHWGLNTLTLPVF
jgi:Ser/Thr protein kinase RdoA (MazF antagonist)